MYKYLCVSLFHGNHERRELCMYARQVLNGVSNGNQGCHIFMCLCVCMSLCTSPSTGVRTAPLGHDGPLPHQNYHCRPLS